MDSSPPERPGLASQQSRSKQGLARPTPISCNNDRTPQIDAMHQHNAPSHRAQSRPHHRRHRPGRLLPGRVPAGEGLRRARHQAPRHRCSTPSASTTSTRTRTSTNARFKLHYGDLSDTSNLIRIVQETQPDEIYNLGAQSHVAVSFESPEYTADVDGLGTLRLLEAIRILGLEKKTRFYQASTSELYGLVQETPQTETTPFYPRSPYAVAKLYAYWITVNYREAYGLYACNGILFNHESPAPRRNLRHPQDHPRPGQHRQGLEDCLYMGNLDALRDWGHAKDYVRMQWLMLQQDQPEDFVIATGAAVQRAPVHPMDSTRTRHHPAL